MSWTGSGLSHETVPQRKPLKTKYSLEDLKTPRTEIFTLLHKDGCNPSSTFLPLEVFDDEDAERYAPFDWIAEQEVVEFVLFSLISTTLFPVFFFLVGVWCCRCWFSCFMTVILFFLQS